MKIAVLREAAASETRAALMPESVRTLAGPSVEVHIESGAGEQAGAGDADYIAAGADAIVTTAKDAVRLPPSSLPLLVLRIEAEVDDQTVLRARVLRAADRRKGPA